MLYICEALTSWVLVDGVIQQSIALDYPSAGTEAPIIWSDVTGQPDENLIPDPNLFVSHGEGLGEAKMDALLADSRYAVLLVEEMTPAKLSRAGGAQSQAVTAKPGNDKPTGQEHAALVARLRDMGITGAVLGQLISASVSRRENARALAAWLRERPKASK